ncbi:MAG TPA: anhydro-N-acetylmuramic acid kinase, partial [Micromonosporaceae bacterium]
MKYTVIGMISGTSYDAIDAAVADFELDGEHVTCHPRGVHSQAMPAALRGRIAAALPPHATTMAEVCRLDTEIGQLFGAVAMAANERFAGGTADLVVSHGQTTYHWVEGAHAKGTL